MVWVSSQSRIAFGQESTFGTAATTDRFLGITNSSVQLPDKTVDVKEYNSFGQGRRRFLNKEGRFEYGPASIDFLPTTGELFWYAFGTEQFEADTPNTGTNTHTLTTDDKVNTVSGSTVTANPIELPSMTLAVALEGNPNFLRTFTGTVVDGVNVSLSESGELSASMDFRAQSVEDHDTTPSTGSLFGQPTSDDSSSIEPYMFYDRAANITMMGTYDYSNNTMSGGRTWANVKSFDWSISNNLKPLYFTQSSNAQNVFTFTTSQPDFSLSMEIVPDAQLTGSDPDAVYDLLEDGTTGDILIPFQRASDDRLDFVFEDALIRSSPHGLNESGDEVSVSVDVAVEEVRVVSRDTLSAYNTL